MIMENQDQSTLLAAREHGPNDQSEICRFSQKFPTTINEMGVNLNKMESAIELVQKPLIVETYSEN